MKKKNIKKEECQVCKRLVPSDSIALVPTTNSLYWKVLACPKCRRMIVEYWLSDIFPG